MRRRNSLLDDLLRLPWWLNLIFTAIIYLVLKYYIPSAHFQSPLFQVLARALPSLANGAAVLFVFVAALSAFHAWRKGELLNSQTSIHSIKKLGWKDFEYLVSEAFRRKGYDVEENLGVGADGGVDLILRKEGKTTLVQCKQWKSKRVGVSVVRELFGVMNAEKADHGIVVCTGGYTKDAIDFARGNSIELLDGEDLVKIIGQLQPSPNIRMETQPSVSPPTDSCPTCGSPMVLRTAKRGKNIGQNFMGCSRYPKCLGTRNI
jgi:restriction system protein